MIEFTVTEPDKTHLASDLHLNHANIIRYCHRPFRNVRQMNNTLVRNWNETVKPSDTVFYLGDLCRNDPFYWLSRLHGNIIFIRGSHDGHIPKSLAFPFLIANAEGLKLYLVHNPLHAPPDWDGWVVHGHLHNNDTTHYPLINRETRRVNVSVELTQYRPISLEELIEKITH